MKNKQLIEDIKTILKDKYDKDDDQIMDLYKLFLKTVHPESFCQECDTQMVYTPRSGYECFNCGWKPEGKEDGGAIVVPPDAEPGKKIERNPNITDDANVPDDVKKMLSEAEETTRRAPKKIGMAEQIRKLKDKIDSGVSGVPTDEDTARVKMSGNTGDVNWV